MSNLSDFMPKAYPGLSVVSTVTLKWSQTRPIWQLDATDTSAGAEAYPIVIYKTFRNVTGAGGQIQWQAQNATPTFINIASIAVSINTLTAGAEDSEVDIAYYAAGTIKFVVLADSAFSPNVTGNQSLGLTGGPRWLSLFLGDGTVTFDALISGSTALIGAKSNHPLNFKTNDTVRGGFDALGNFALKKAFADQSASLQVPVNAFSITIGAGVSSLLLNPAGTLATGTITMPAAPVDGQIVRLSSTQTVTALTHSPNSGQTITGPATFLGAAAPVCHQWNAASSNWFRVA